MRQSATAIDCDVSAVLLSSVKRASSSIAVVIRRRKLRHRDVTRWKNIDEMGKEDEEEGEGYKGEGMFRRSPNQLRDLFRRNLQLKPRVYLRRWRGTSNSAREGGKRRAAFCRPLRPITTHTQGRRNAALVRRDSSLSEMQNIQGCIRVQHHKINTSRFEFAHRL